MPVVKVDLLSGRSAKQKEKLAKAILSAFEENDIPKEWVTIVFQDNPLENWVVAGEMLAEKLKKEK